MKQNKYSIEKAFYSYLLHLDSYKQIDHIFFFFFNCTYKLSLGILLYYFSVQEVKKKKRKCTIGQSMPYSLLQGTETLEIYRYMYLLQFTITLRLIFVKKQIVLFHSKHALNFFKTNNFNGDFKH